MTSSRQVAQLTAKSLQRAILLAGFYVALIFILPASRETMRTYHLSAFEYRIILFAITLPVVVTWLAAFIGYAKLSQYVYVIRKSPEGTYFDKLATGCAWLAWSLPLAAILALVLNSLANSWPSFRQTVVIIDNYFNLLMPLVAFSLIGVASRGLINNAKIKFNQASTSTTMLVFLTAGVSYCYLTFKHFDPTSLSSTHNPYFLPVWLMVISVIIPYLYAWSVGLLAAYEISLFSKQTKGILYRQALHLLVVGLIAVIISSIALQYINGIQPRVGHLMLNYQLVVALTFRLVGGSGFVLLAIGANRLKKIEEV